LLANYGLIGLFFIIVALFSLSMPVIPVILRYLKIVPSHPGPVKNSTFECGVETIGKTWVQFNFHYYFYALVFLAIDVLVVFLYPWAVIGKQIGAFAFWEMAFFLVALLVGYAYVWKKGGLQWE